MSIDDANCIVTSSPRKKSRLDGFEDSIYNASQVCDASVEDTAMFIQYHVMSYALKVHQLNENDNSISSFPLSSSQQVSSFWKNKGSTENKQQEKAIVRKVGSARGIDLAREILMEKECKPKESNESVVIRNVPSEQDFKSKASYERFLVKENRAQVEYPHDVSKGIDTCVEEHRVNKYATQPSAEEMQLYLLPEVRLSN